MLAKRSSFIGSMPASAYALNCTASTAIPPAIPQPMARSQPSGTLNQRLTRLSPYNAATTSACRTEELAAERQYLDECEPDDQRDGAECVFHAIVNRVSTGW